MQLRLNLYRGNGVDKLFAEKGKESYNTSYVYVKEGKQINKKGIL